MSLFNGIYIVGLTGQSGAGKSTVSAMLRSDGLSVIDADAVSRSVANDPRFLCEVKALYADCVTDMGLDRQRLAAIVFNDAVKLKNYTDIIYPYITKAVFTRIKELKNDGEKIIVLDAPTLFESGLDSICSCIVSVIAPFDVKVRRILERDGIPVELVESRISSQNSEEFFRSRSDFVINNSSDINKLEELAHEAARYIKERFDA